MRIICSVIGGGVGIQRASVCKSRLLLFIVHVNSEILGWQIDFYEQWQQWFHNNYNIQQYIFVLYICRLVDNNNILIHSWSRLFLRQRLPVLQFPLNLDAGLAVAGLLHHLHALPHLHQKLRSADFFHLEPGPGENISVFIHSWKALKWSKTSMRTSRPRKLFYCSHLARFIIAVPRSFKVSAFQRGYPGSTLQRTSMDSSQSSLILMKSSFLRVGRLLWE